MHLVSGPVVFPANPAIAHESEHSAAEPTLGPAYESVEVHGHHHDARTRYLDGVDGIDDSWRSAVEGVRHGDEGKGT